MNNFRKTSGFSAGIVLIIFVVVFSFALSGCTTLRRKFVRKRQEKKDASRDVPIFEPIEYAQKAYDPQELYRKHFSIWGSWSKELVTSLERGLNKSRQSYLMTKSMDQLVEMGRFLTDEKKEALSKHIKALTGFKEMLDAPVLPQDFSTFRNRVKSVDRRIRNEFSLRDVQTYIIRQEE